VTLPLQKTNTNRALRFSSKLFLLLWSKNSNLDEILQSLILNNVCGLKIFQVLPPEILVVDRLFWISKKESSENCKALIAIHRRKWSHHSTNLPEFKAIWGWHSGKKFILKSVSLKQLWRLEPGSGYGEEILWNPIHILHISTAKENRALWTDLPSPLRKNTITAEGMHPFHTWFQKRIMRKKANLIKMESCNKDFKDRRLPFFQAVWMK